MTTLDEPLAAGADTPASTYAADADRVALTVNGAPVTISRRHPHVLHALREELGVLSPKDGCSPQGQCGCCTVLVDGKAQITCQLPPDKVAGKSVVTLEGMDPAEVQRYADTFAACAALQCGFCTPGILVRARAQIDKKGDQLTRDEMARHLGGHLCRCTGYVTILDAIDALAKGQHLEPEANGGVGSSGVKYEALTLATGARGFVDDIRIDGMLHGAVHLSAHARADIVRIDTAAAAAVPGVVRVLTAADVPGTLKVGIIHQDWPVFIPEGGRTSYRGDVLAFVVAEDREIARRAAELVEVEYRVLRPITDPVAALADPEDAVWGLDGNRLSTSSYRRGDVEGALATSAHTVHEFFITPRIEHAFLEPESTVALPFVDDAGTKRLHVWSGGQGVWDDRNQICDLLGLGEAGRHRVTVELVSNGGAFGGKEDMANQGQTALAAWLLDRPVKCTFSREESLFVHSKRHGIRLEYWAGCDADGRLTALKARMIGDSGPYASVGMKVLERAAGHASGPYHVPAIDVESIAVRTNNPNCGAFRGFGANQAQFAMEGVLDRLAERVAISGWEIRKRNVIRPGVVWGPGQVMDDGCRGAEVCLDAAKPHLDAAIAAGKAVGLGLGLKNSGLGNGFKEVSTAVVRFLGDPEGTVEVRHCWTEMGQGMHTVALQVAVEELGIDPSRIRVIIDTTRDFNPGQTTGSRGALMGAGAVMKACQAALAGGCEIGKDYEGRWVVDWTDHLGDVENPTIHAAFGYAAQVVVIDRETATIEKVVAIHDVGKAVNPQLCRGQIEGSVHMGLGYALSEEFPADGTGTPTNMTLRSLGILRPKDVPAMEVELVECPQPMAPYGIKGVGEIGLVPTAGAMAAALHDLDGVWRSSLPMMRGGARPAGGD
jgi:xanthine dehydrogenase molybdenum-binding subunit